MTHVVTNIFSKFIRKLQSDTKRRKRQTDKKTDKQTDERTDKQLTQCCLLSRQQYQQYVQTVIWCHSDRSVQSV